MEKRKRGMEKRKRGKEKCDQVEAVSEVLKIQVDELSRDER